ncbi:MULTISPECIES: SAM-dependent methyltransferase [unclassified Bradyrhizobium]|uniref:SAM-dependent methyltransferase n=2 Tax=Bradyrhizobium TaxID=374 RepID=UPI002FE5F2F3
MVSMLAPNGALVFARDACRRWGHAAETAIALLNESLSESSVSIARLVRSTKIACSFCSGSRITRRNNQIAVVGPGGVCASAASS